MKYLVEAINMTTQQGLASTEAAKLKFEDYGSETDFEQLLTDAGFDLQEYEDHSIAFGVMADYMSSLYENDVAYFWLD